MEKTIREICLICKGERWLEDPKRVGQSLPCSYCQGTGWVVVAPANFPDVASKPSTPPDRKH